MKLAVRESEVLVLFLNLEGKQYTVLRKGKKVSSGLYGGAGNSKAELVLSRNLNRTLGHILLTWIVS